VFESQDLGQRLVAILPRLRRFAYGLTGSMGEGDDLLQATCERALSKAHQFDPRTRLEAWVYTIMKSVWIDGLRKHREVAMDQERLVNHPGGDAAVETESRIRLAQVRKLIAKLPEDQRVVLLLVSVEGMKYREVAAVLGCPIGTVMSRLSRARLALGAALEGDRLQGGKVVVFPG
jgi:RNA polymerase sigma-70 factor (ECF subfamily)